MKHVILKRENQTRCQSMYALHAPGHSPPSNHAAVAVDHGSFAGRRTGESAMPRSSVCLLAAAAHHSVGFLRHVECALKLTLLSRNETEWCLSLIHI